MRSNADSVRRGCLNSIGQYTIYLFHQFEAQGPNSCNYSSLCRYCKSVEDPSGKITYSEKLQAAKDLADLVAELKNG